MNREIMRIPANSDRGGDSRGEDQGGSLVGKMESSRVEPWGKARQLLVLIGIGGILLGLVLVWAYGQIYGAVIFVGLFMLSAGLQRYLHDIGSGT